ncbi:unnamed protein product [Danaus chrysippus]|uniref:(African queen) hypothetical protein n=1 Tax=Danaus chrysippus TaxID=151541 RepID=A0A8J2RBE9_9NEOP|nr:unnamed protein product [Danaus chrysippus]
MQCIPPMPPLLVKINTFAGHYQLDVHTSMAECCPGGRVLAPGRGEGGGDVSISRSMFSSPALLILETGLDVCL